MPRFDSPDSLPAVIGANIHANGVAIEGDSVSGWGVYGHSKTSRGVVARSESDYGLRAHSMKSDGIRGSSDEGQGIWGQAKGAGVGVLGTSEGGAGVHGKGNGIGVVGESVTSHGVFGESKTKDGAGVWGENRDGGAGVVGKSKTGIGVWAVSETYEAVHAETKSPNTAAIAAYNTAIGPGAALFAKKEGGEGHAGFFDGNVWIGGELGVRKDIVLANADCAEDFDVAGTDKAEPGTVMVLGNEGVLSESQHAYDKRVAGVISGAGDYRPGIVLDKQQTSGNRQPIALLGKVFCKVDAQFGAIEVGDLLTTSPTPGHAMKTSDPLKAFGAVIGKALRPLTGGQGLIPILIALQ